MNGSLKINYKIIPTDLIEPCTLYFYQVPHRLTSQDIIVSSEILYAVKISYKNRKKPVLTIREAILDPSRIRSDVKMPPVPDDIGK